MSYEGGNLAFVFISYLYCITIDAATYKEECLQIQFYYQTVMILHALFLISSLILIISHYFIRLLTLQFEEGEEFPLVMVEPPPQFIIVDEANN